MVINQVNLSFLTDEIGLVNYRLLKETHDKIIEDGHFHENNNDKALAILLFISATKPDYFHKKVNLIKFCNALPILTQSKIIKDLELNSLSDLQVNEKTIKYFQDDLLLPEKFRHRIKEKNTFDEGITHFEKPILKYKRLKKYQSDIFYSTYKYIHSTPRSRCIIQMPTGSGKTRTAMEIICEVINDTKKDVVWLANTEELCDQAYETFKEVWYFLGKIEAQAINHLRYKSKLSNKVPSFHVATIQSFNSANTDMILTKFSVNVGTLGLVVVDEAHISIAPTYKDSISSLLSQGAKLIGLTATPGRRLRGHALAIENDENYELSNFYYNKIFQIDSGDVSPIDFLRKEGVLSRAIFKSIEGSSIQQFMSDADIKKCIENKTIPKDIESLLTNDSRRSAIIFDQLVTLLNENKKILFFATSILHSKVMTTLLTMKGYNALHVDGGSGRSRSNIIDSFKTGETQILSNYGVLSTGFDDPEIDVVFMARPTNSIVLYSQIIGRGLRGPKMGGTDSCEIYTVFDNIMDLPNNNDIYNYFEDYYVND